MAPRKLVGPCSVIGCGKPSDSKWLCQYHYQRLRTYGTTAKINIGKRSHPLYIHWFERKSRGSLCSEWMDFWTFVEGVGERPSEKHFLAKDDLKAPYGPGNARWETKLEREEDESLKKFWARKWASRQAKKPEHERCGHLRRTYGITSQDYDGMLERQNSVCAICLRPETKKKKAGVTQRLAVDHCHETGKIRDLLCWQCNTMIGKIEERIDLLDAMKAYLIRHNGEKPKEIAA